MVSKMLVQLLVALICVSTSVAFSHPMVRSASISVRGGNSMPNMRYISRPSSQSSPSSRSMSVEGNFDPEALKRDRDEAQSGSVKAKLRALYKFTRPHTIRGTILASLSGTIRALVDTPGSITNANWGIMLPRAIYGVIALLMGNVFIVGINQIYDEDIDKLNKPFLPVASGEMSKRFAWVAVVLSGVLGPVLVRSVFPRLLFRLYSLGIVLGGIYSVPPIRTKKNPVLAGLTIACVRGFLLNFGIYYAVKDAVGASFSWSPKVAFIARFMTTFATVIAVTKDLPDIEGDKVRYVFFPPLGVITTLDLFCSIRILTHPSFCFHLTTHRLTK
jgi:homogentisate solanesyltransferase